MTSPDDEYEFYRVKCLSCGSLGLSDLKPTPGAACWNCPVCGARGVIVIGPRDTNKPSLVKCVGCGYRGLPGLNFGPCSDRYYLRCPHCGEINDVAIFCLGDPEPSWKIEPGSEDIMCARPDGPFFYIGQKIGDDWIGLIAWMTERQYWPRIWVVPSLSPWLTPLRLRLKREMNIKDPEDCE
jgi:hypothetical protein